MVLLCRNKINPLQRRFAVLFSSTLLITALLFLISTNFREGHLRVASRSLSPALSYGISLLPVIPFLAMMLLIPRYLRQEKDEFVRALVLRALLIGFAVPMVIDTVTGIVWKSASFANAMPMFNIDLFCVAALVALTTQLRRYQ